MREQTEESFGIRVTELTVLHIESRRTPKTLPLPIQSEIQLILLAVTNFLRGIDCLRVLRNNTIRQVIVCSWELTVLYCTVLQGMENVGTR